MIVTEILGNRSSLSDDELAEVTEERVSLGNLYLVKRVQRLTTDAGREVGLRLPSSFRELRDGDILHHADGILITVEVAPTDVLVIRPTSTLQMGKIAHSLGNRHLQAQFFGEDSEYGQAVMVVQYDHTVEHFLDHVQAEYTREMRVLPEAFRHAEHSH